AGTCNTISKIHAQQDSAIRELDEALENSEIEESRLQIEKSKEDIIGKYNLLVGKIEELGELKGMTPDEAVSWLWELHFPIRVAQIEEEIARQRRRIAGLTRQAREEDSQDARNEIAIQEHALQQLKNLLQQAKVEFTDNEWEARNIQGANVLNRITFGTDGNAAGFCLKIERGAHRKA
ncbi:MAG: hypothetical protein GY852_10450, partial [bacterium]|nr:hypothetical protein [bacterium]